jgi:glycosyltransferase involved in cell wall biosynthesis
LASEFYFVIPGDLNTLTGGFIYDKRVIEALQNGIMPVLPLMWQANFLHPTERDRAYVAASLATLPDDSVVLVDGLAFGTLPTLMIAETRRLRLIALVHHPLGYETGLPPDIQRQLIASERQAFPAARHVITTSAMTAQSLIDDFGIHRNLLTIAPPGGDPPVARPQLRPLDAPPLLLSVGAVIPRKGHDLLVQALGEIGDLSWTCIIAGSLDRDPQAAARLRVQLAASNVSARISLAGEIEDVQSLYAQADIFVLASHYEGYGMAFAEALGYGLPIIGTTGGAIPEVVSANTGLLITPGSVSELAAALREILTNAALRQALAAGARKAALAHPSWYETARVIAGVVNGLG